MRIPRNLPRAADEAGRHSPPMGRARSLGIGHACDVVVLGSLICENGDER
jgi:hypothetical protein